MCLIVAELGAYSHFVSREFSYIIRELIEAYGWTHIEPWALRGGMMRDLICRYCGEFPKIILFWGGVVSM
jgi:hypothetical protein